MPVGHQWERVERIGCDDPADKSAFLLDARVVGYAQVLVPVRRVGELVVRVAVLSRQVDQAGDARLVPTGGVGAVVVVLVEPC